MVRFRCDRDGIGQTLHFENLLSDLQGYGNGGSLTTRLLGNRAFRLPELHRRPVVRKRTEESPQRTDGHDPHFIVKDEVAHPVAGTQPQSLPGRLGQVVRHLEVTVDCTMRNSSADGEFEQAA